MKTKNKQCEARHPLHNIRCWLKQHGPEERHLVVLPGKKMGELDRQYWSTPS